ncbi:MAG: hypothetical protein ABIQ95_03030, partial [Bdellovibrionia bacterium]
MRIKILLSILTAVSYFQNDAFSGCPPIKGFDETNTKNIHAADYFKNNILVDSDVKTRIESQKEKFWIDLFPAESYPFKGHHEKLIQLIDQYHHLDKSEKVLIPNRRRALKKIIDQSRHDLEKTKNDWTLQLILQTATSKREYLGELSFIGNGIQKMLFRMPGKQNAQVRHIENNYHYEVLQHMDPGGRSYESLKELLSLWTFCKQEAEFAPAPAESSKRYYPEFFLWLENPFFADFPFDTISRTDLFPDSRKVIFDEEGKAYSSEYGEPSGKTLTKNGTEYHPIRMLTYHYMIDENGSLYV